MSRIRDLVSRKTALTASLVELDAAREETDREGQAIAGRLAELLVERLRLAAAHDAADPLSLEQWRAQVDFDRVTAEAEKSQQRAAELAFAHAQGHVAYETCAAELATIEAALARLPAAEVARATATVSN